MNKRTVFLEESERRSFPERGEGMHREIREPHTGDPIERNTERGNRRPWSFSIFQESGRWIFRGRTSGGEDRFPLCSNEYGERLPGSERPHGVPEQKILEVAPGKKKLAVSWPRGPGGWRIIGS